VIEKADTGDLWAVRVLHAHVNTLLRLIPDPDSSVVQEQVERTKSHTTFENWDNRVIV